MKPSAANPQKKESLARILILLGIGLCAGFANGLLGAGGGIVAVFGMMAVMGEEADRRDIFANALCIMLPLSALSCIRYGMEGHLTLSGFGRYVLPAIAGGLAGAYLLGRLKGSALKKLFGALVVWSGVLLIIR